MNKPPPLNNVKTFAKFLRQLYSIVNCCCEIVGIYILFLSAVTSQIFAELQRLVHILNPLGEEASVLETKHGRVVETFVRLQSSELQSSGQSLSRGWEGPRRPARPRGAI